MSGFARIIVVLASSFLVSAAHAFAPACSTKTAEKLVIALDVGHLPTIPEKECSRLVPCRHGATSARGVTEYEFNVKLAASIKEELVRAGFRSTQLMEPAPGSTLQMRVDRASALKGDFFLSIHHDGVRDRFLKPWTFEGQTHWYFDQASGFSLHVSPRNAKYRDSLGLARAIADQLMASGLHFSTTHEPDNPVGARAPYLDASRGIYSRGALHVLTHAEMPAVLLEGGTIVNRDEEVDVSTEAYRSKIAAAVAAAIRKYCGFTVSDAAGRAIGAADRASSPTGEEALREM